jgi:galactokinase
MNYQIDVYQKFKTTFGSKPYMVRSPARINLIGEHTDYNQGFVLPAAIDKELIFALAPNPLHKLRFFAFNLNSYVEIPDSEAIKPFKKPTWVNYLLGVIEQLQNLGHTIPAFDCVFGGNIPNGAGLSSSAAVECGLATALNEVFNLKLSKLEIVKLCQKAENEFVGVKCGIMDQFANTFGQQEKVILLDCRSLEHQYFSLKLDDLQLVLLDTGVHHSLASSEYNTRIMQCEEGVGILQKQGLSINSLREVTVAILEKYKSSFPEVIWKRCNYVVKENERVQLFCQAIQKNDFAQAGKLMFASHAGLQYEYEVSCKELDFLVNIAANDSEVLGARMMGGGFGGCTLSMVKKEGITNFVSKAKNAYMNFFDMELKHYIVNVSQGTSVIHLPFD